MKKLTLGAVLALVFVMIAGVFSVQAQDPTATPEPVLRPSFTDGRLNAYDPGAPVAVFETRQSVPVVNSNGVPTTADIVCGIQLLYWNGSSAQQVLFVTTDEIRSTIGKFAGNNNSNSNGNNGNSNNGSGTSTNVSNSTTNNGSSNGSNNANGSNGSNSSTNATTGQCANNSNTSNNNGTTSNSSNTGTNTSGNSTSNSGTTSNNNGSNTGTNTSGNSTSNSGTTSNNNGSNTGTNTSGNSTSNNSTSNGTANNSNNSTTNNGNSSNNNGSTSDRVGTVKGDSILVAASNGYKLYYSKSGNLWVSTPANFEGKVYTFSWPMDF